MKRLFTGILAISLLSCTGNASGELFVASLDFPLASGVPAGVYAWPHKTYIFEEEKCSRVISSDTEFDLQEVSLRKGQTVVSLMAKDTTGINVSPSGTGFHSGSLCVEFIGYSTPVCASYSAEPFSGTRTLRMESVPLTMSLSLSMVKPTLEMSSFSVSLKNVPSKLLAKSREVVRHESMLSFVSERNNVHEYHIVPSQYDSLYLEFVRSDGSICKGAVSLPEGTTTATSLSVTADFSRYASTELIDVKCVLKCPDGEKETQSEIDGRMPVINSHYGVWIFRNGDWQGLDVRDALVSNAAKHASMWNDWDNSRKLRDTMSYCIFTDCFESPVKLRIQKKRAWSSVKVRPTHYGIRTIDCGNGTVEIEIPSAEMGKLSVEFDGDRYHNLILFGSRPDPDVPDPDTPGVIYYGPGEHNVSRLTLYEGQTLYVDEGAVMYGEIRVVGSNTRISGRGVISGAKLRHYGDQYSNGDILVDVNQSASSYLKNVTIEGVTFIDSPSWCLRMNKCRESRVDGVNMIHWILNGDGIDICNCDNIEIKNCFIRTYDDCISLKSAYGMPVKEHDMDISDCLVWADLARGIVVGPESGSDLYSDGGIENVTVDRCIFLEHPASTSGDNVRAALSIMQFRHWENGSGTARPISGVRFSNLIFDDFNPSGTYMHFYQSAKQEGQSRISDVTLENIEVNYTKAPVRQVFLLETDKNQFEGLRVKNFTINGEKVTGESSNFKLKGNIKGVTYE